MLYLMFSLTGILLIVVLNQWLGTWHAVPKVSAQNTIEILKDQHAGLQCGEVALSKDNRIGIARLTDGRFGLVCAMADNYVTRIIEATTIASVRQHADTYLKIRFNDLTLPSTQLSFTDSQSAARWQSYFTQPLEDACDG